MVHPGNSGTFRLAFKASRTLTGSGPHLPSPRLPPCPRSPSGSVQAWRPAGPGGSTLPGARPTQATHPDPCESCRLGFAWDPETSGGVQQERPNSSTNAGFEKKRPHAPLPPRPSARVRRPGSPAARLVHLHVDGRRLGHAGQSLLQVARGLVHVARARSSGDPVGAWPPRPRAPAAAAAPPPGGPLLPPVSG